MAYCFLKVRTRALAGPPNGPVRKGAISMHERVKNANRAADNGGTGDRMILQTLPATGRWNLFKIEGQLDFAAAPTVQAALLHAAHIGTSDLLIDLEDLATVDEIGVAKLTSVVQRLVAERPSLQIAFVAKDSWLADTLKQARLPKSVVIFRNGTEALKAIGLHAAA
jgi:anti-anti-sigma regulatory factor